LLLTLPPGWQRSVEGVLADTRSPQALNLLVGQPVVQAVAELTDARFQLHRLLNALPVLRVVAHCTPLRQIACVDSSVDRFLIRVGVKPQTGVHGVEDHLWRCDELLVPQNTYPPQKGGIRKEYLVAE